MYVCVNVTLRVHLVYYIPSPSEKKVSDFGPECQKKQLHQKIKQKSQVRYFKRIFKITPNVSGFFFQNQKYAIIL